MNLKKTFLIIILIILVIGIVFIFVNANNVAEEKISSTENNSKSETSTTNMLEENTTEVKEGKIRRTNQKVEPDMNNILEIKDNFFIEQTNDMYYNLNDYLGKTVKIEGFVSSYTDNNGDICYGVIRNTPGCCGADGLAGLDIRYDGEYPEVKTWVEVIGVIGKDISYDAEIPAIQVTSIREKEEGTSFVTN
ncbi:MAG: hypothetical protein J6O41_07470 [Clostridia bacterium]|nr:hypothetical protein [Clostridia bacterium]